MTECWNIEQLKVTLNRTIRHIKADQCTICATEIIDQLYDVLDFGLKVLRDIDLERSEIERARILSSTPPFEPGIESSRATKKPILEDKGIMDAESLEKPVRYWDPISKRIIGGY